MTPEAQRYLAEQVAFMRQTRAQVPDRVDLANSALAHFGTGLRALRAVGAVTEAEFDDWMARAREASEYDAVAAVRKRTGPITALPAASCTAVMPRFLGLMAGPDEEYELHGGRLRILCVELYDSEMALNWRMAPVPDFDTTFPEYADAAERDTDGLPEEDRSRLRDRRLRQSWHLLGRFAVTDDAGHEYQSLGSFASWGSIAVGRATITPALQEGATALLVDALGVHITVQLSSRAR